MPTSSPAVFLPTHEYLTIGSSTTAWILPPLLPVAGTCNLYGRPKVGKSFLALQLALAIADPACDEVLSFPIETHGPVCYLQLDTPRGIWTERLAALHAAGCVCDQLLIADTGQAPAPFDIMTLEAQRWLAGQIAQHHPILTVIDTLRELHSGDENKSDQMRNVILTLAQATHPSALLLLSHTRKENLALPAAERESLMTDARGSSYVAGRVDAVMRVTDRALTYQSRTSAEHRLACSRTPTHLWQLVQPETTQAIQAILADTSLPTFGEKVHALAARINRSEEACRSLLRRRLGAQPSP